MGTSTCFYNALSRNQDDSALVAYYSRLAVIMLLVCMGGGALTAFPLRWPRPARDRLTRQHPTRRRLSQPGGTAVQWTS